MGQSTVTSTTFQNMFASVTKTSRNRSFVEDTKKNSFIKKTIKDINTLETVENQPRPMAEHQKI